MSVNKIDKMLNNFGVLLWSYLILSYFRLWNYEYWRWIRRTLCHFIPNFCISNLGKKEVISNSPKDLDIHYIYAKVYIGCFKKYLMRQFIGSVKETFSLSSGFPLWLSLFPAELEGIPRSSLSPLLPLQPKPKSFQSKIWILSVISLCIYCR